MANPIIDTRFAQRRWNLTLKVGRTVKYIVVHYTGTDASALNNVKYFSGGNRNASADFFIDKDGSTYQFNAEIGSYYSWHCGDGRGKYGISNANSIGIEVVSSGAEFTDAQKKALRELVTWLMGKYGIKAENVVRHYDASRKTCPAPYAGNAAKDAKWRELHAYVTGGTATAPESTASKPAASSSYDGWVARLQRECNAQGFSKQAVDGIPGPITLAGCPTLYKGSKGNITKMMQERCNDLGYRCGTEDGINGANTQDGIKAFQRAHGLTVDGIVGKNTWRKLIYA